jgi:formate hydrogenlyase subunit 3/multisubunit Na+/H+ antiporter MnhD subunit
MMVVYALYGVAALIVLAPLAVALGAAPRGTGVVYGASLIVTLTLGIIALLSLFGIADTSVVTLPLGLPWLGAHFRIDALSAFFLVVVNLGGAAASLFALGYGRHEDAPQRVLPFYPAYLAAMNLVVIADDAFSFLVSWEFMSLTSWALVIAHHRVAENVRAGYIYLLMAGFGTLALLLGFGLLAGADGNYAFDAIRASHPSAGLAALVLVLTIVGAGRAEPRLGADERRDDQGRGLRPGAHHVRSARAA